MSESEFNQEKQSDGADVASLVRMVTKEWLLVVVVAALVVAGVAARVMSQTPIYSVSASLKIDPNPIRPLGREVQTIGETNNSYWNNMVYLETQYRLIKSRTLAEDVVRTLRLHKNARFLASVPENAPEPKKSNGTTVEKAAEIVSGRLDVAPVKKSRLVELSYEDADPKRARQILEAIAISYMEKNLEASVQSIGNASEWLNNQQGRLKEELEKRELELHEYKKKNRLLSVTLDDRSNMLGNEMAQLNTALTTARTQREKLASRVAQLNRVKAADPSDLPVEELLSSPTLQTLREAFEKARMSVARTETSGRGENHPEVKKVVSDFEASRKALLAEVRNIQESARRDLKAVDQEIAGLHSLFKAAEQEAFKLNLLEIEYRRLARARENTERLHSIVLERGKDSELSQQMKFSNVTIVDPPLVPTSPSKPRVFLSILGGGVAGVLLGVLLALLRVKMDVRIRGPGDIEEALGLSCLATIPEVDTTLDGSSQLPLPRRRGRARRSMKVGDEHSPELWVHHQPRSTVAEAVRTLRTNLMFMAPDQPHRKFLVTSAGPTDGKTTIASNLAITLAQSGLKVLLLDADLRRPRLTAVLSDETSSGGLTTALLDHRTLGDAIVKTKTEGLSLLPSGPLPPNPSELLHSESFQRVLEEATARFDRIVIDSPPLMPVTDAAILSRLVDTTILVVRSGSTHKDHGRRAIRALRDVKADIAGAVLNGHSTKAASDNYYNQYYGYSSKDPAELSS